MEFISIQSSDDVSTIVKVLNESHSTVARDFGFTREMNPTNNAFIGANTLKSQLNAGIELFQLKVNNLIVGCIAIEKSVKEMDTFYIEKVSVLPEHRNNGYGVKLMEYATLKISSMGGKWISIALIDSHRKLKNWYTKQGFAETGTKEFPNLPFQVCFMRKKLET
jgi:diamine N-acetyltransferase